MNTSNSQDVSNTNENERGSAGYWLGFFAKIVLAVAMLLYLGMHSYNFFTFTFKGDQWIFAILGLFTTSIGFILWLVVYLYGAEKGLEKAISIIMLFVSLLGEFAVAGFDMYMNITGTLANSTFTDADLRNMSYIIAGLALLNGLALVAGVAGQQIINDLSNVNFPRKKKSNVNSVMDLAHNYTPMISRSSETEKVTLISDEEKAMYAPGTQFRDGTANPPREERPAETPFRPNGQSH
jgi:hypothetical protein